MIKNALYYCTCFILVFLASCIAGNESEKVETARSKEDCLVCDRLLLFQELKAQVAEKFWPSFNSDKFTPPLVYFNDSQSWLAFAPLMLFNDSGFEKKECPSGIMIYRMGKRYDRVPFHMENKMNFSDSSLPYYYNPIMFCSGVEQARKQVPEVTNSEEWLQMVMHEYFHAFQFSHEKTIHYLADSVAISSSQLDSIYLANKWFREHLARENDYLLKALSVSTDDSARVYCEKFSQVRKSRRQRFAGTFKYDLTQSEKFWEMTEGTARYIEYNMGHIYMNQVKGHLHMECDTLFNSFNNYSNASFLQTPWFKVKTEIMPAYYYVTGFNLCRVLDRFRIHYKEKLAEDPSVSLEDHFNQNILPAEEQYRTPSGEAGTDHR